MLEPEVHKQTEREAQECRLEPHEQELEPHVGRLTPMSFFVPSDLIDEGIL